MSQELTVVTGAAGFIGSRLATRLLTGERLILVDDPKDMRMRDCCAGLRNQPTRARLYTSEEFLHELKSLQIRRIFHMGACSRTDETRQDYLDENNTAYTRTLWDYCTRKEIPFFYASSAATYGAGEQGYSDDPSLIPGLKPMNLYGLSKQKFDVQALAEAAAGKAPPLWAGWKFFNVYGPGEEHKGSQASVLFHAFNQLRDTGKIRLFKSHVEGIRDGDQKRDFIHVDDVVDAMLWFSRDSKESGIFNLGTGEARSFRDLAKAAAAAANVKLDIEWIDMPEKIRAHYQNFTQAEMGRLRAVGWKRPFQSLEDGARAYYKEWKVSPAAQPAGDEKEDLE
jgi:ADP-L-glycero-D-manno-heptose 6-epimerase